MLLHISFLLFVGVSVAFNFNNVTNPGNTFRPAPGCYSGPRSSGSYRGNCKPSGSASCEYRSYTAIGDSYSAGLNYASGLLPDCNNGSTAPCNGGDVCLRNSNAFPMLMQNAHDFSSFQFIACSGANTTECDLDQVKSDEYDHPDLVSVTIGGDNNQAFLGLIVNCVYQRDDTYCQYAIENAEYTISTISGYLSTLFSDVAPPAGTPPRQKVVVLSYPRLWSTTNQTACQSPTLAAVPMSDRQTMNDLAIGLNAALESAAEEFGFTFVDTDALFEGNRLCDNTTTPYFQYDFATALYGVFHPTEVGQQQFFKALEMGAGCG